jgi:hypothetical protein
MIQGDSFWVASPNRYLAQASSMRRSRQHIVYIGYRCLGMVVRDLVQIRCRMIFVPTSYTRMQILHAYNQLEMVGGLSSVGLLAQLHAQRL